MTRWLVLGVVAGLVVGCGSDDEPATAGDDPATTTTESTGTTTTTTTVVSGGDEISLEVEVGGGGDRSGALTCGEAAEGTGFLADPAAAEAACELLRTTPAVVERLVEGRPADLMCTQVYGGPEVAQVTGEIEGQAVDQTIDRTDGCGIADWDSLTALLGPPG